MKKITLLLALCLSFASYAQYLTEGFEGGATIPAGWTLTQTNANETWTIITTTGNTGANSAGVVYDDTLGAQDETLTSPVIDLSTATNPQVTFFVNMSYFWSIDPNNNYDAIVSVFDGTTTTQIWEEADLGVFTSFTWIEVTLDLTAYAGNSNVQLLFNYTGTDGASLNIDDILVEEPTPCTATAAPDAVTTPTPADAATGVVLMGAGSDGVEFSWVEATTGELADTYTISIGQNLGADDIGTLEDVTSGGLITFGATPGTTYFWKIEAVNCFGSTSSPVWSFTTEACTDPLPDAVTTPTPADGATDVVLQGAGLPFSWVEATTGSAADSFTISIGLTATGDDIGSLADVTSGGVITFGATYGTTYYWKIDAVNCAGSTSSAIWSFTTITCTETAAPTVAATAPTPADAATAVAATAPDGGVTFSWTDSGTAGETYNLNIGVANPPTQTLTGIESGDEITGFAVSTTYFWSIDVVNCFGTLAATEVWSFTTDATLGIEDNNILETFSVYPNPTSGVLNIQSSQDVDNVTVFNLLGQNVASFAKNEIVNSSINLSELSKGLYLVKITSGDKTQTLRVTKQ